MPMDATPFEQEEPADATKCTGLETVELADGEVTLTLPRIVTLTVVPDDPPQLSHSFTSTACGPRPRLTFVSSFEPFTTYESTPGEV